MLSAWAGLSSISGFIQAVLEHAVLDEAAGQPGGSLSGRFLVFNLITVARKAGVLPISARISRQVMDLPCHLARAWTLSHACPQAQYPVNGEETTSSTCSAILRVLLT